VPRGPLFNYIKFVTFTSVIFLSPLPRLASCCKIWYCYPVYYIVVTVSKGLLLLIILTLAAGKVLSGFRYLFLETVDRTTCELNALCSNAVY
jgi:hypothetical protein